MYDLGSVENALGAYAGELPPEVTPDVGDAGMGHLYRNALMLARGPYYVRAIGSSESERVIALLRHLRARFETSLPGEALPWAYALFTGALGLDPGAVSYAKENAFSFGFAREVYSARLEDESEVFVLDAGGPERAASLVGQFTEGFRGYGEAAGTSMGVDWTEDRYLHSVAGAKAQAGWVIGVKDAPDLAAAESHLRNLEDAVRVLPEGGAP
jgi:hypothetical protein